MKNKSYCNLGLLPPVTERRRWLLTVAVAATLLVGFPGAAPASDAPPWMHALVNVQLPPYDEKTEAVLLYSETNVTVISTDKIRTQVREAYKILRPEGRDHGTLFVHFNPQRKVKSLHGWCIPAQGKDYEVKDKDALEVSPNIQGAELISDVKYKVLHIPAPDVGNIVGYEYEVEDQPFFLQDMWDFQGTSPVRETHYSLQLPAGWEYKAAWLNHAEVNPTQPGGHLSQWALTDIKGIRREAAMPPHDGVAGAMVLSFFPPGGPVLNGFKDWDGMGKWYTNLMSGRMDASAQIKQEVATLTDSKTTQLQKMQALAEFVQRDIRYVAIELGIGGWQPHPAADVFSHRYGDCKDKATLLRSMLQEIGVESYHLAIYTERGAITPLTPAHHGFNHAIIGIKLSEGMVDRSLVAVIQHPKLGRILFFDPTNDLIPFGQLPGYLQANYGLLVTPDGGELVELPQQPSSMNSIQRTAKLTLDSSGTLRGDVKETRLGERASSERGRLRTVTKDTDRIKPIEELLSNSLTSFRITHATLLNLQQTDQPFGFNYSFESQNYAKSAGNLLLVRPRVIGSKGFGFLETKEPRIFPVELEEPARDTDTFEITIPPGYTVDDLPPPVDADYSFASYHSKTVINGNVVDYTRTFEVKELSVPVNKAEDLRKFYRIIAGDERNTMVLKPIP
jgi:predicted transglutaminase-like cysteine proteinase